MKFPLSQIQREIKKALIESEGVVNRSDFFLTDIDTGEELQLCMTPEKISVKTTANFRSWNVINIGEIKLPRGEKLTQISWNGILPGTEIMWHENLINLAAWENPHEVIKVFNRWRERGAKLKLLITQTPINLEVFIKNFDYSAQKAFGHYKYDIDLIAAKDLQVKTVAEADADRQTAQDNNQIALNERAAAKARNTGVRVQKLNDIYIAAQVLLGNASWENIQKILERNGISITDIDPGRDPNDPLIIH